MSENFETTLQYLDLLDPPTGPEPLSAEERVEHSLSAARRVEHWCGVPDRKDEKLYARAKFASFADMRSTLTQWGETGYGICIAINEMSPNTEKRRSPSGWAYEIDTRYIEQVKRIRALFADFDNAALPDEFPIEPTMIVQTSPKKFHVYWCIDPDDPLPIEDFSPLQKNIAARYRTDPSAADLNRVLRVPGSLHRKSMPRLVEIIDATGKRHGAAALREAFPAVPPVVRALKLIEPWNGVIPYRAADTLQRVQHVYGEPNRSDGGYDIECPWASEHTSETSKSATTYWPPSANNDGNGAFNCKHAHCAQRATFDFNDKLAEMHPDWKTRKRWDPGAK